MGRLPLAIDMWRDKIVSSFANHQTLILKAAPGTGKTTRVPKFVQDVLPSDQKTIVLEPRRLAAKLSALRIAEETDTEIGTYCGYQIRFEKKFKDSCPIIFVTEGIFINWLTGDAKLSGISCVILDEFHERNLHTDMALAFLLHLQKTTRPDLKLIVMSATLDTSILETHIGNAAVLDIPGQTHSVELRYVPPYPNEDLPNAAARAITEMSLDSACKGHILCFQPGVDSIMRTKQILEGNREIMSRFELLPLFAALKQNDQQKVFRDSDRRKIIIATNIAETSLTIDGVGGVVDTGLAKQSGHAPWSGMPTLETKQISKASAIQRAGRAGRTQAGVVYRVYDEATYLRSEAFTAPEILRVDLTSPTLQALSALEKLGITAVASPFDALPWLECPDERDVTAALELLRRLGCIDETNQLTDRGRFATRLPLHPRLASLIDAGRHSSAHADVLLAATLISEQQFADRRKAARDVATSDLALQMDHFKMQVHGLDWDHFHWPAPLSPSKAQQLLQTFQQLRELTKGPDLGVMPTDIASLSPALLAGYGDRVAKVREETGKQRKKKPGPKRLSFVMGRGGQLAECSVVQKSQWLIMFDATERLTVSDASRATIVWQASAVSEDDLLADPCRLTRSEFTTKVHEDQRLEALETTYYGQLVLKEERREFTSEEAETVVRSYMTKQWPAPFANTADLDAYHCKVDLLKQAGAGPCLPKFEGEFLELLISEIATGKTTFESVLKKNLLEYIREQLTWEELQALDSLPDLMRLENGETLPVSYDEHGASIKGYIQSFFGIRRPVSLLGGRLPIRFVLLGPNQRPAQITNDWDGFWRNTYPELKRELSRRYPRHHWPENPLEAIPALTLRQLSKRNN